MSSAVEAQQLALDAVLRHADAGWVKDAEAVLRWLAVTHREFTSDEVWQRLGQPREPKALGAVLRWARREGLCEPTDRTRPSRRRQNHARPIRVWRSRLRG